MTWQHWILAIWMAFSIVISPILVNTKRSEYTPARITRMAIIQLVMLVLLVWGER